MKDLIQKALPTLNEISLHLVVEKMVDLGVECEDDIQLLEEHHLVDVLKPIQIKKLLLYCAKEKNVVETITKTVVDKSTYQSCSTHLENHVKSRSLDWIKLFEVPWEKMPDELLQNLQEKTRPLPTLRLQMIRIVCEELRKYVAHPGRGNLRIIAESIVQKYPDSFKDTLSGSSLGNGYASIFNQLESRIENQNRNIPLSSKRPFENIDRHDKIAEEPSQVLLEKIKRMQDMFASNSVNVMELESCLQATYSQQKTDINEKLTVVEMKEKWPGLMTTEGHLIFFKNAMDIQVDDKLRQSIQDRGNRIEKFITHNSKRNDIKDSIIELQNAKENGYICEHLGMIVLLMLHFRENPTVLFLLKDATVTDDEVANDVLPNWPCIIIFGPSIFQGSRYLLSIDGIIVSNKIPSSLMAISMLFASFYIFSIEYPKHACITLEFIQRCLLEMNPPKDGCQPKKGVKRSKGEKIHPKILTFLNAIKDFELDWSL